MKLGDICISVGVGLGVGVVLGCVSREYFRRQTVDAIEKEDEYWREKLDRHSGLSTRAFEEIRWLRNGIAKFCNAQQTSDIFSYVFDNTVKLDEKHPEYRKIMEERVNQPDIFERDMVNTEEADKIAENLGYKSRVVIKEKPPIEEVLKARMKASEDLMAESEYPGEEVGSERLAPNGDILDEAWDPAEEYTDEFDKLVDNGVPNRPTGMGGDGPYIIMEFDYIYTLTDDHDKIAIDYYAKDDTFVDDNETVISKEEMDGLIKLDNLRAFEETEDPAIFIRNEEAGADFEILWNDGAWGDDLEATGQWIFRPWDKER